MVHPAAGAHRLLLERAQARRGLARVEDARAGALDRLHVARRQRRDARQPAEEVERHALGRRGSTRRCRRPRRQARPRATRPRRRAPASAARGRRARTPSPPRAGRRSRRAPSARSAPAPARPGSTTAAVVRSPSPTSSARARSISSSISARRRGSRSRGMPGGRVGVQLVERLALEQRLGQRVEPLAVVRQQLAHVVELLVHDPAHLGVDQLLGRLRDRLGPGQQRALAVARRHREEADLLAHPPALDHPARDPGELLDVGLGARGRLVVDDLLGHAAAAARP